MVRQIKNMTKLELCNLYGINVFRFTKDRRVKRKYLCLLALWCLLLVMLAGYLGGLSYGLISLGLGEVVPAYLLAISSLMILVFGMLKAGSMIFRREGYEMLCAMPFPAGVLAVSRLLRMYAENLLLTVFVLLPGCAVYAWELRPGASFYLAVFLEIWAAPMLPMAVAVLAGALVTGISSRMRHKSLAASVLSVLAVLAMLLLTSRLSVMEGSIDAEMMKNLSAVVTGVLKKVYPPAVWLGMAAVHADLAQGLLGVGVSVAVFAAVSAGIVVCFPNICQRLCGSFAAHSYHLGGLKAGSVMAALVKREFRRYFSSSVYVTNTIIGPVMGCVLAGAVFVTGTDSLERLLPVSFPVRSLIPYALAGAFCMMTTTAVSISMEGKNWWIVKTLPLSAKAVMDAKILMNLLLMLPFYLVSEVLLILALRPGILDILWLFLIPAVIILFSCVYGLAVNLHFPVMDWENEASIVKQSLSATLGGMGGFVLSILCIVAIVFLPGAYVGLFKVGICIFLLGATAVLYREICK